TEGTDDSGWGESRTGWPAPQEAAATSTPASDEPASSPATSSGGGRVLYGDSGLTTATPNESALRPAETTESPVDTTAASSAGAAGSEMAGTSGTATDSGTGLFGAGDTATGSGSTGTSDPGTTGDGGTTGVGAGTTDTTAGTAGAGAVTERASSAAEDPQEQPFERDGRWWFRRGDELLVYEEQTGQWVAADEPAGTSAPDSAPAGGTADAAPAEGQVTTQQEAVGSFWKCPSCGAVNGSTATSCRMCFTARP
ncbi:MAG: zinc finger Ran-binding domain-containing protein, partial [Actinomycetota bacterium]|nr:zinc finger Ran-binding domain-containing protein [Actinomycetota bacterium]